MGPLELARTWDVPFVEAYDSIGSTNDRALSIATEGAPAWTVVVADEQTAGRGRRGAQWVSPAGSGLWLSVLLRARDSIPELPLLVGLACAEGIESLHDVRVGIKWPNDLQIDTRKLGGVLCETSDSVAVAGFGINVSTPDGGWPSALSGVATSLEEHSSKDLGRSHLATEVLVCLRALLSVERPFAAAHAAVQERDVLAGQEVVTEQGGAGRAVGIDEGGALLMERSDQTRVRIFSGSNRLANAGP
jgi:BirA family biotin operon repressor/biotin-[acetyl-CoA-carboxylase] ligase